MKDDRMRIDLNKDAGKGDKSELSDKTMKNKKRLTKKISIRSRNTQRALGISLVKLLEDKPIDQITVKELSELAGINRSTFYLHFKDISDIYRHIEAEFIGGYIDILEAYIKESMNKEKLIEMFNQILKYIKKNAERYMVILKSSGNYGLVDLLMKESNYINLKIENDVEDIDYLRTFMTHAGIGVITKWISDGMKKSPEEMTDLLIKMLFDGSSDALKIK